VRPRYLWRVEQEALAAAILGVLVCPDYGLRLRGAVQGPAAAMYTPCVAAACLAQFIRWVRDTVRPGTRYEAKSQL
jgi:hypothetical protein